MDEENIDFLKENPWLKVLKDRKKDEKILDKVDVEKKMGDIYNNINKENKNVNVYKRLQNKNNIIIYNNIDNNEPRVVISFRFSRQIYNLYHNLPLWKKRELIRNIEALIIAYCTNRERIVSEGKVYNFNINISSSKSIIGYDEEILKKKLEILEKEKNDLKYILRKLDEENKKYQKDSEELLRKINHISRERNEIAKKLQLIRDVLQDEYYDTPIRKIKAIRNILGV